jgi:hypothetical protein
MTPLSDSPFTPQQRRWLDETPVPERLFLKFAAEFDDRWLRTSTDRWEYRYSGMNIVLDFRRSIYCRSLSHHQIKLIKIVLMHYVSENAASSLYRVFITLSRLLRELTSCTHDSFITGLNRLAAEPRYARQFFCCLYACRKLDTCGFFSSTDGEDDIEEKLLFTGRPLTGNAGMYSELGNVIPSSVCLMTENGLLEWAARFAPSLSSPKQKQRHLEYLRRTLSTDILLDCIILALCYYTGARPVQLAALAAGDIFMDTTSDRRHHDAVCQKNKSSHGAYCHRVA